jgi:hypothetical protein
MYVNIKERKKEKKKKKKKRRERRGDPSPNSRIVTILIAKAKYDECKRRKVHKKNSCFSFFSPLTTLHKVKAPQVWARLIRGEGLVVANADTGVQCTSPLIF